MAAEHGNDVVEHLGNAAVHGVEVAEHPVRLGDPAIIVPERARVPREHAPEAPEHPTAIADQDGEILENVVVAWDPEGTPDEHPIEVLDHPSPAGRRGVPSPQHDRRAGWGAGMDAYDAALPTAAAFVARLPLVVDEEVKKACLA